MDVNASAGKHGGKKSYFEHCEKLAIKAYTYQEAAWLAAVASTLTSGGELVIRPRGKPEVVVEFPDAFAPREADGPTTTT